MKLFITGATGYIGQQLALAAAAKGFTVAALVRDLQSPHLPRHPSIRFYKGDVTHSSSVTEAMKDCRYVVHAAALTKFWHKDSSQFYRVNVLGTRHVLEAARLHGVEKLVFTSSGAVLGPSGNHPLTESSQRLLPFENEYERSKQEAEELVKEFAANGLHAVIVAPPRVYGPGPATGANPITKLINDTLRRGLAFMPSTKNIVGNYAYVDDVVQGHFDALEKGRSGEKYILGGENISYEQLFRTIGKAGGKKLKVIGVPLWLLKAWAGIVFGAHYLLGRHTHLSPKIIDRLVQNRALSSDKAVRELGYQITPFETGIANTVRYLQSMK